MKKFLALMLAFFLAGCGGIAPAQPTAVPATQTPVVVVATVLVPVTVEAPTLAPFGIRPGGRAFPPAGG